MRHLIALMIFLGSCQQLPDVSTLGASAKARKALGMAQDVTLPLFNKGEEQELHRDHLTRRHFAWELSQQLFEHVPTALGPQSVPRFFTWYGADDLKRIFRHLLQSKSREQIQQREPFQVSEIESAINWNTTMVESEPHYNEDLYQHWLEQRLGSRETALGLSGLQRTFFSPATLRHLLMSYPEIIACAENQEVIPDDLPGLSEDNFTRCLPAEFPKEAVLAKTSWRRIDSRFRWPVFATGAAGLSQVLQDEQRQWLPQGEVSSFPGSLQMELPSGATFELVGIHFMSKVLREWFWISLFSASDRRDFASDRPLHFPAYKLCAVTDFIEQAQVDQNLANRYPSLAEALQVIEALNDSYSWCSNPYLEQGPHNGATNCIGCHQYGGANLTTDHALQDQTAGRGKLRENFPTDYLYSIEKTPENIGQILFNTWQSFQTN